MTLKQFTRADDKIIVNMDKVMMMKEKDGFLRLYFASGDFVDVKSTLKSIMRWYQKQSAKKAKQTQTIEISQATWLDDDINSTGSQEFYGIELK